VISKARRFPASPPPVEQVFPGIWSIPVPIPNNPLRYVLTYALELEGGGIMLVDSGWDAPEALEGLEAGLAVAGATLADVRGVAVTHIHPDHYGLAGRVREVSGAWLALHPADAALIATRYGDVDELLGQVAAWLRGAGTPEDEVEPLTRSSMEIREFVKVAPPTLLIGDGDPIAAPGWDIVAIHTPGHSPGHVCFHERRTGVVFTGDHVLPHITPNISVHPQSGSDPLGAYLTSLERMLSLGPLPALPGHEQRFPDLEARVRELLAHHEHQLEQVLELVVAGADTAWEVTMRFPWSRSWDRITGFIRRAAIGETHAHLVVLERRGLIAHEGDQPLRWHPV
jgi:glyoxylase-like metal-dependent hydrolase (beta-lactamase superfamily II)